MQQYCKCGRNTKKNGNECINKFGLNRTHVVLTKQYCNKCLKDLSKKHCDKNS